MAALDPLPLAASASNLLAAREQMAFTLGFQLYPSILSLLEGRLRAGALIVADNADASPEYLARVRSTAHGYLSIPFADDVELSMRLGIAFPRNGAAPHV